MGTGKHKLSDTKIRNPKPGKYIDGAGLHLEVTKTGLQKWKYRYTLDRRRREMHLGSGLGLKQARDEHEKYAHVLKAGNDPIKYRQQEASELAILSASQPKFITCAADLIRSQRRGWKNKKHARQWVRTLRTYACLLYTSDAADE